jgi:hypothetical protein
VPAARIAGIFAVFISLPAVIALLGDEPSAGRLLAVAAALVIFFWFFFQAVRGRMHPKPPAVVARAYVIDLVIAGALTGPTGTSSSTTWWRWAPCACRGRGTSSCCR